MATGDLTTLANVKQVLHLTTAGDDLLLMAMITRASQFIQKWLNRTIASQAYTEQRDGRGGDFMVFANYPVTAVSSVKVNGYVVPASPDNGIMQPGYGFDATTLWLSGFSFASAYPAGPSYVFTRGRRNVQLVYTAGFAATPPEIEAACIELVTLRFRELDRIGHRSKSLAGEVVTFLVTDFHPATQTILQNYKKVIPL